jgi:hypothetical protein
MFTLKFSARLPLCGTGLKQGQRLSNAGDVLLAAVSCGAQTLANFRGCMEPSTVSAGDQTLFHVKHGRFLRLRE